MKQRFENDVTMFGTVRDFMGDHTDKTAGIGAIAAAVSDLDGIIGQLDAAGEAQAVPLTGVAADKDVVRTELEEAVFAVSDPLAASAAVENDLTLLAEVAVERSALDALPADALDALAGRVHDRAVAHQTALTAGGYGVTTGMVTAIATARTDFAPWVTAPRTAVAERAGQTAAIPGLVRQGKELLRGRLDRLMSRFRLSDAVFYASYRTARAIVDRRGGGGSGGGGGGSSSSSSGSSSSGGGGIGVPALSSAIDSGVVTLTMSATGATVFNVYQKGPSDGDFVPVATEVPSGWQSATLSGGSGEWAWEVAGVAGGTEGPRSAEVTQGL